MFRSFALYIIIIIIIIILINATMVSPLFKAIEPTELTRSASHHTETFWEKRLTVPVRDGDMNSAPNIKPG